ncbi:hypothetical protein AMECASPLE_036520, partial [Ameca splendens]
ERNYICDQCGQTFKQRKHLSVHQMRHSGAKPLQCEVCGFQCRQRASLKYHMTKHKAEADLEFECLISADNRSDWGGGPAGPGQMTARSPGSGLPQSSHPYNIPCNIQRSLKETHEENITDSDSLITVKLRAQLPYKNRSVPETNSPYEPTVISSSSPE